MSESSPENQTEDQTPGVPEEGKKVPVEAVAKERAEKRAARAEADKLKEELAKRQESNFSMESLANLLAELVPQQVEAAVSASLRPLQDEVAKSKMAVALGLNEAQADAVNAVKSKYAGIPAEDALILARREKPDLFPQPKQNPWNPSVHTGMPVTGDSPLRGQPSTETYESRLAKAQSPAERTQLAQAELFRRVMAARGKV